VAGYARCPKCHASLPRRLATNVEGGTALDQPRRFPLATIIAVGVVGLGLILWLGLRHHGESAPATVVTTPAAQKPAAAQPAQPALAPGAADTTAAPQGPAPDQIAADLRRTLDKQRLWSTVTVTGSRVEVRSSSCGDAAIQAPINSALRAFKAAGLTELRCVEQSGAVVFTREL
jgi:hypothetical protein